MKSKKIIITTCIIILILCYTAIMHWDPFHFAPNGLPIIVGGAKTEFFDATNQESIQTSLNFAPYSHERVFSPKRDYYLISILELREVTIWDERKDISFENKFSIMRAEINTVFHDTMGLTEGEKVMLVSSYVSAQAKDNPYIPELVEGRSYYAQLWEVEVDHEKELPYRIALDEMADYFIQYFCYGIMPLREDGMVEYYHKMMPGGKLLPYEWNTGPVWSELPKEEFEKGFRKLIDEYCKQE